MKVLQNKITTIFFKCRDAIPSASKLQNALLSETNQTINVTTEMSNDRIIVEHETQTDLLHVRHKRFIIIIILLLLSIKYRYCR